jgi:hypothetical protein
MPFAPRAVCIQRLNAQVWLFIASKSIERAAVLLKAGSQYSEFDVTVALNETRRAIIVTHDEIGDNSRGLIEAFDAAIAMAQSGGLAA